jgi:hypothetical protein
MKPFCRAAVVLAVLAAPAGAQEAPALTATPHQIREQASQSFIILPLWDTTWWISVRGRRGNAPLEAVEYHARFTDGPDARTRTGSLDLDAADRDGFSGRIMVTCPTRPDYLRPLRVRLRLRDTNGEHGQWVDAVFPVHGEGAVTIAQEAPADALPLTTQPETERRHQVVGTVQVEVGSDTTIAAVRAELRQKAREQGGDAAVGFRLVSSRGEQNTFAADVIRYVEPTPTPAPTTTPAVPAGAAPAERVLGEIDMPAAR